MKRTILFVVLAAGAVGAQGAKAPTVKEIMTQLNKPSTGLYTGMARELREADPEWGDLKEATKEIVKLTQELGKAKPPKGEKASWEKLTKAYAADAKALDAAVGKKDRKTAQAVYARMGEKTCNACHEVHRKK
jgi:hypothetical protein